MKQHQKITTNISILIGLLIGLLGTPTNLLSQTKVKIGNIYSCSNTEVIVPVEMENFEDIGAYTIYIEVNTENIEYIDVEGINEVFSNGSFVYNFLPQNQYITFNWTSLSGVSIESGVLCNLRVKLKEGQMTFAFLPKCEIVRSDLSIINDVRFINGNIVALNSILPDPVSQTLAESSSATIELPKLADNISYQWQINSGNGWINLSDNSNYSGVQTSKLVIQSVTSDMDNTYYRSLLTSGTCSEASETSELFVTISSLTEKNVMESIVAYPVPATDQLNCSFISNVTDAELRLENLYGERVLIKNIGNVTTGEIVSLTTANVGSGVHILRLYSGGNWISNNKIIIH
jgi:cohesin domain-containing protein